MAVPFEILRGHLSSRVHRTQQRHRARERAPSRSPRPSAWLCPPRRHCTWCPRPPRRVNQVFLFLPGHRHALHALHARLARLAGAFGALPSAWLCPPRRHCNWCPRRRHATTPSQSGLPLPPRHALHARSARRSPRRPRRSTFPSSTIQVRSPSADLARVARCPAAPSNAHAVRAEFGALCVSQARGHVPRPMFLPLHFVTAPHALRFCSGSGRAQRVFCPKSARAHASLCGRADHTACALSNSLSAHVARTGYVLRLCVLSVCVSQVHVPILA